MHKSCDNSNSLLHQYQQWFYSSALSCCFIIFLLHYDLKYFLSICLKYFLQLSTLQGHTTTTLSRNRVLPSISCFKDFNSPCKTIKSLLPKLMCSVNNQRGSISSKPNHYSFSHQIQRLIQG